MYNINELATMEDANLQEVAQSMGIKKFDPAKRQETIYQILDKQAEDHAAASTSNAKTEKKQKKDKDVKNKEDKADSANKDKKRPGRPKSQKNDDTASENEINNSSAEAGPQEFIYYFANAELVCTDSFHGTVFSIIFDNHYMVGDVVEINGFKGEVISLGLQSTKIKSYTGEVFIIGNSLITSIINYSQNDSKLLIDIPVSYNTNINKLEKILDNLRDRIENIPSVRGGYELLGVDSFSSSAVIYKIVVDCICNEQFGVKRKILKLIKEELDKNKIEIPYNKLDVYIK